TADPLDAALCRRAPVHRPVREHDLLPAADAGPAGDVDRAGRADLLFRAAVCGSDVVARPRGAALSGAMGRRSADPGGHGAGGPARESAVPLNSVAAPAIFVRAPSRVRSEERRVGEGGT